MDKPENNDYVLLDKEKAFHNNWAKSININKVMVDESFEACTCPENRIIIEKLGNVSGKKMLELGCGTGEASVYFAKKGVEVTATDISGNMLDVVRKVARKHGVYLKTKRLFTQQIPFDSATFDIVYAANLLHHVNVENTLKEVYRVLKRGGIFVSWDPLKHNPLINIYRRVANKVRTEDEHPLRMQDLKQFKNYFSNIEIDTTWFFTLWIFIKFYFLDKIDPNKERYWKKIIIDHRKLEKIYFKLEKMDKIFLRLFPFMKRYCWNIVIFAEK